MLTAEAFGCWRPWELARVTDYQIRHVYLLPALKRTADAERRGRGAPTVTGLDDIVARGQRPSKESVVQMYRAHGMSAEGAARLVEDQWREWDEMDRRAALEAQ